MKSISMQQVSQHEYTDKHGFKLLAVVSRLVEIEVFTMNLENGGAVQLAKDTPIDCYYVHTYYMGDRTNWETYDRLSAMDVPDVLNQVKSEFENPKKSDL